MVAAVLARVLALVPVSVEKVARQHNKLYCCCCGCKLAVLDSQACNCSYCFPSARSHSQPYTLICILTACSFVEIPFCMNACNILMVICGIFRVRWLQSCCVRRLAIHASTWRTSEVVLRPCCRFAQALPFWIKMFTTFLNCGSYSFHWAYKLFDYNVRNHFICFDHINSGWVQNHLNENYFS